VAQAFLPVQAQVKAYGYGKLPFERNSTSEKLTVCKGALAYAPFARQFFMRLWPTPKHEKDGGAGFRARQALRTGWKAYAAG
jgi:hypothetical protein